MQRFCHRTGVGIVGWRQGATAPATATLAPRDNHRRLVARGRHGRVVAAYGATGVTSVASDLAASYAAKGIVSADVAAAYSLCVAVVSDLGAAYEVLSGVAVQSALVAGYYIHAAVVADVAASYLIDGSVDVSITGPGRTRIGSAVLHKARRHITFKAPSKRIGAPSL